QVGTGDANLAEQLAGDVAAQAEATDRAKLRGRHLEHVAELGHRVNQLGSDGTTARGAGAELFAILAEAAGDLDFEAADVWIRRGGEDWLAGASHNSGIWGTLPAPGQPGSGLRPEDMSIGEVVVDDQDVDPEEWAALEREGLSRLIRITLATIDGTLIVLRAADSVSINGGADAVQTADVTGGARAEFASNDRPALGDVEALRLLAAQATVALQNNKLLSDLQTMHDELEHQASHDVLTGLPNRKWFMTRLRRQITNSDGPGLDVVLFLDLNGFKQVNDTMGHEAGDELLVEVSGRLREVIGSSGELARLGGDEFTVLAGPVEEVEEAQALASRIHASLVEPFDLQNGRAKVGTSIGIAVRDPATASDVGDTELLRRADAAMYAAKTAHSDLRTAIYDPSLDEGERRRGRLVAELRRALDEEEIEMAFQPVVGTESGRIAGVEALLRWTHRELGPIDTGTTLSLAEEAGLSSRLNRWILEHATQTVAAIGVEDVYVAVNLSPTELGADDLMANVGDALHLSGIAPDRLVIELSERLVSEDRGQQLNIDALSELGVVLSLDDFGEGRTSLAHLRGLPISQLKIDRRLVQNACESEVDLTILRSVTELAQQLSMEVVAEGIETPSQRQVMADLGIELVQGYGLFRPLTADKLRRLLLAGASAGRITRTQVASGVGSRGGER
ncbi:MAG: EAL domain-containing protein, partial [Moorea sp. SIO1F2]|uniref:putative bifunctional diguanylate cyclase/phosphodiesterase n=1 Tax=Moorena sp. SIO1F2 TaxID=2607819 RepID=UPI0013B79893